MPAYMSIAKKRPFILTFKASLFFLLILCTFIFAPKVSAFYSQLDASANISSESCTLGFCLHTVSPTITVTATTTLSQVTAYLADTGPTFASMEIRIVADTGAITGNNTLISGCVQGTVGCTTPDHLYITSTPLPYTCAVGQCYGYGGSTTTPPTLSPGTYHLTASRTNGNEGAQWKTKGSTTAYTDMFIELLATGESGEFTDTHTRIYLNEPLNQATSTTPVNLSAFYYINLASSTLQQVPSSIRFDVQSQNSSVFFGTKSFTSDIVSPDIDYDTLSIAVKEFTLPEGVYTWKASLMGRLDTTEDENCGLSAFCYFFGHSGTGLSLDITTAASTTIAVSETRTLVVGSGGRFSAAGSTTTEETSSTLTFCRDYDGGNIIVIALCFIPNTIADAIAFLVMPDDLVIEQDFAIIRASIDNISRLFPWGYATRFYSIITATSTATSTLPTYTVVFQTAASTTESLTFDPGDMILGGGTLLASIHDPINDKTARDVFEPFVQLSVALSIIFTIVADLTGSHKHNTMDIKQTNKKLS